MNTGKKNAFMIAIDAGTTNTRVSLVTTECEVCAVTKDETGVRNTAIDGNNNRLKAAIKSCLEGVLSDCSMSWSDISCVVASGMITSNVGVLEVPHCQTPAGMQELADKMVIVSIPEICPLPIYLIPGIKNRDEGDRDINFERLDMMRGEEVEAIAVVESLERNTKSVLLVLPGSHTKFVTINEQRQITGCLTTISGELLSVITNNTILADSVGHKFVQPETYDKRMVLEGYRTAEETGLGRACFSGRILNQLINKSQRDVANFLLGAVLQGDVKAISGSRSLRREEGMQAVIAGREPLATALCDVLEESSLFETVMRFRSAGTISLSARGALLIARQANLI